MGFFFIPTGTNINLGINKVLDQDPTPYCSVDDVERFIYRFDLDIPKSEMEERILMAIFDAEAEVENYTKNDFHKTRREEYQTGEAQTTMSLDFYPILELETVTVFTAGYNAFFVYDGKLMVVDNLAGTVSFPPLYYTTSSIPIPPFAATGFAFLPGMKNIQVIYTSGYEVVPKDIRLATTYIAAAMLMEQAEGRYSEGLAGLNVSGQSESYGWWSRQAQFYRARAYQMLDRYKRVLIRSLY